MWSWTTHSLAVYEGNLFVQDGESKIVAFRSLTGYQDLIRILLPLITELFIIVFRDNFPEFYSRFKRFYQNQYIPLRSEIERIILKEE
jgi:hypothetical protein